MNAPILAAVAIGGKIESVGSYLGFAAVVGLGVLSLLYFAQAREVKRLREWAGRSPERDAELALRVQADAQRRVVAQPVASPRSPAQPASPQTAAAQQADAARKAAAAAGAPAPQPGTPPVVGPPGQLDRAAPATPPAVASSAPGTATAAAGTTAEPAAPGLGGSPAAPPALPAAATAAAAAARQAGPPARTPVFANGGGGQDTHESDAARPAPLPDLPPRAPRAVTPASSRLSDDDGRAGRGPRIGLIAGGCAAVLVVGILLMVVLTSGGDPPPASNEIKDSTPPPAAAASPSSSTKVDRKSTQVAVLNGTTQTGLARNVGNKLESSGFTILSVGDNADQQIATTTISYSDGNEKAARVVAQIMGAPSSAVQPIDLNTATAVAPEAKVVVVVGSDRSNTG